MLLALAMFAAGLVEFVLAAYWTHVVARNDVARAVGATFATVMLWGFVVSNLQINGVLLLVAHGAGCSLGAGIGCWWAGRKGP